MNTSASTLTLKSTLLSSAIVLLLASCSKENIQPSTAQSSDASIKGKEMVIPSAPDRKVISDNLDMAQVGHVDHNSANGNIIITDPIIDDRFKESSNDEDLSTASIPVRGDEKDRFRQRANTKKYSIEASKPGIDRSRFRQSKFSKNLNIN